MRSIEQWQKVNMYVVLGDIILQLWPGSKFCFLYAYAKCMSDLCSNFQTPASNTVGGVRVTPTILQCDIVKICISFRGHNSAIMSWMKIIFLLCICSMHGRTVLQVSNPYIKYCRRRCRDKNSTTVWYGPKYVCHSMGCNSAIWSGTKLCFLYAHVQCISELCFKFQVPASNTSGGVAETRIVLQCGMVQNMSVIQGDVIQQ